MIIESRIVTAARSWLGTRFHHQGRLKKTSEHKGGVDCLGLLVGIAKELDLKTRDHIPLTAFDRINYSDYPDAEQLSATLSSVLYPITIDTVAASNILLFNIDNNPQHLAIASDLDNGLGIIHAYAPARMVVEHSLDSYWRSKYDSWSRAFNCI